MSSKIHEKCLSILKKNKDVLNRTVIIGLDNTLNSDLQLEKVLRLAFSYNFYIFIITERPPEQWNSVLNYLRLKNIPFTSVFTSSYLNEHPIFKIDIRDKIQHINPNKCNQMTKTHNLLSMDNKPRHKTSSIIMCIGDSWFDLLETSGIGIKLASPRDRNCYVYESDNKINVLFKQNEYNNP